MNWFYEHPGLTFAGFVIFLMCAYDVIMSLCNRKNNADK